MFRNPCDKMGPFIGRDRSESNDLRNHSIQRTHRINHSFSMQSICNHPYSKKVSSLQNEVGQFISNEGPTI